jgi:hypothetical protein
MTDIKELQTELTVTDLKIIAQIIDLASSKGLFKGSDMLAVGMVYKKIEDVVKNENK